MTKSNKDFFVQVASNYQAPFPDPIRVNQGDMVAIDVEKQTSIPGWVWCTHESGKSGWVPEAYIDIQGMNGKMKCDYDSIELTVSIGNILTVHKEESDFYWVTDQDGQQGWVPISHVAPHKKNLSENREAA